MVLYDYFTREIHDTVPLASITTISKPISIVHHYLEENKMGMTGDIILLSLPLIAAALVLLEDRRVSNERKAQQS